MKTTTLKPRVLPADVYDTLELIAEAYGGIGAAKDYEPTPLGPSMDVAPFCVWGAADFASGCVVLSFFNPRLSREENVSRQQDRLHIALALSRAGIGRYENDEAVSAINAREGKDYCARVTFAEWAAELNVVRGEQEVTL